MTLHNGGHRGTPFNYLKRNNVQSDLAWDKNHDSLSDSALAKNELQSCALFYILLGFEHVVNFLYIGACVAMSTKDFYMFFYNEQFS